jgi:hypothetical protein
VFNSMPFLTSTELQKQVKGGFVRNVVILKGASVL